MAHKLPRSCGEGVTRCGNVTQVRVDSGPRHRLRCLGGSSSGRRSVHKPAGCARRSPHHPKVRLSLHRSPTTSSPTPSGQCAPGWWPVPRRCAFTEWSTKRSREGTTTSHRRHWTRPTRTGCNVAGHVGLRCWHRVASTFLVRRVAIPRVRWSAADSHGCREWVQAEILEYDSGDACVVWRGELDLVAGGHRLAVRAIDCHGAAQDEAERDVIPRG